MKKKITPIVFLILDGWGVAPKDGGNAIALAHTPMFNFLYQNFPYTTLKASGSAVGLPREQAGNSEAGHMNIGAGRVVKQDLVDINDQIESGKFYKNAALLETLRHLKEHPRANVHVVGLLTGKQSSHTYPDHLYALIDFYNKNKVLNMYLHLFSDGRDSDLYDGLKHVEKLLRKCPGCDTISSITGRFYAMDRAQNWERTEVVYRLLTEGKAELQVKDPLEAFTENYNKGNTDEFIVPTRVNNPEKPSKFIADNDVIVFFNCRSERARQLIKPFVQKGFKEFKRKVVRKNNFIVTFTDFAGELDSVRVAFPSEILENTLPCALADNGLSQVYLAEAEKFAHMTYFINGGVSHTRCGEKRIRFTSSKVKSFEKKPAMATPHIAQRIVDLVKEGKYDFIAANFANADMLGHTGNITATIKGVEVIDAAIKKIYSHVMKKNGLLVITADHGNAECMLDGGEFETQHNHSEVPLLFASKDFQGRYLHFKKHGKLAHVVPTLLDIAGLEKPKEMVPSLLKKYVR